VCALVGCAHSCLCSSPSCHFPLKPLTVRFPPSSLLTLTERATTKLRLALLVSWGRIACKAKESTPGFEYLVEMMESVNTTLAGHWVAALHDYALTSLPPEYVQPHHPRPLHFPPLLLTLVHNPLLMCYTVAFSSLHTRVALSIALPLRRSSRLTQLIQ
jgi:hypothetical protein